MRTGAAVDELIASDPDRLEAMGERELEARVRAESARLDPAAVVARRRRAESDRHVTLRPAPDTMTWLTALLPVADGVAALAALTAAAATVRGSGDPRSKGQVMADTLVDRVLGQTTQQTTQPPATGRPRTGVSLNLVMTDDGLFGGDDGSAHLDGYGPLPAELARELIAGACTAGEKVWLRRLYCRPDTGDLHAADTRRRRFPEAMARFIRLRDQVCRTPWCDAPIRHIDHATSHSGGGPTDTDNGQGLCEACNYAKQAPGWRASPREGQTIETTLPTGHRYRTRPPRVVATVSERPIRIDYILTG